MYGPKMNKNTRQLEIGSNTELRRMNKEPDVGTVLRYRIAWDGHMWSNSITKAALKPKFNSRGPQKRSK